MKSKFLLVAIAFIVTSSFLHGQSKLPAKEKISPAIPASNFSLHLIPAVDIPIGSSSPFFNLGGSLGLGAKYIIPKLPLLFLSGGLDYGLGFLKMDAFLNKIGARAGLGLNLVLTPRLSLNAFGNGGYSYSFINTTEGATSAWIPYINAGIGAEYRLLSRFGLEIGAVYNNFFTIYQGIGGYVGTVYYVPQKERLKEPQKIPGKPELLGTGKILELSNIEFVNVFPVFRKYYDDHPVGKATLKNPYNKPVTDIQATLIVRQYMDAPKQCTAPDSLQGGEAQEIKLNALFTDKVLEITEATKAAVEIGLEYSYQGNRYKDSIVSTMRVFDRNALTWDDDRKAAAFVTAKDPSVLTFSKNIAGMIKDKGSKAIDNNLLLGMALHEALSLYGMSYIPDPKTPYAEFSKKKDAIDFLQFPRQSLDYRAGDCDDLSILYSSLLSALGVETAFITIPGHIFMSFALDMSPDEARKSFFKPDELIYEESKVWVPVEVTELGGGFLAAWQIGAKEWKENAERGQTGFYPLYEAWKLYEPVGLPPGGREITLPPSDRIVSEYLQELVRFIDREISPRVNKLETEIAKTGSVSAINNLGVVYARYGLTEKAEEQFRKAVQKAEFIPALVNLGNIYYLKGDMSSAAQYYQRAYAKQPGDPKVLLCIARVNHELANYSVSQSAYRELEQKDPQLAKEFAYLGLTGTDAGRAAQVGKLKEKVIWEDE
jgi:tetratricopeptide (TPR) repeat protein